MMVVPLILAGVMVVPLIWLGVGGVGGGTSICIMLHIIECN